MKRECIYFQCGYPVKKTDYPYIIMQEAIIAHTMRMCIEPTILQDKQWRNFYTKLCKKMGYISYSIFLPRKLSKKGKYIFVFNEIHPIIFDLEFIKWVKKKYDVKVVLVIRNMIRNKMHPSISGVDLDKLKEKFDLIVTDEKKDADLYKLFFLPDPFSIICRRKAKIKNDICFIGLDKGRGKILKAISEKAYENNVRANIKIVGKGLKDSLIEYTDYQSYLEIIKQDMESNCILEVLQPGQDSYTLRLQEAVCLGKKLLTNNLSVVNEKYYNPRYIQIFNKVDDINWNFVKERVEVDYKYEGEYSPLIFLEKIEQKLNNMDI